MQGPAPPGSPNLKKNNSQWDSCPSSRLRKMGVNILNPKHHPSNRPRQFVRSLCVRFPGQILLEELMSSERLGWICSLSWGLGLKVKICSAIYSSHFATFFASEGKSFCFKKCFSRLKFSCPDTLCYGISGIIWGNNLFLSAL